MAFRSLVQKRNRKLRGALLVLGVLAILSLLLLASTEEYFFLYPAIDTRFAPGYSEAEFHNIQAGMTKEDVLQRLGPPLNTIEEQSWIYSEDNAFPLWDFAWLGRAVQFNAGGEVTHVSAGVFYD